MAGDVHWSSDDGVPPRKRLLGVRYEPSISIGNILILLGFVVQAILFWAGVEHRLTKAEDGLQALQDRTDQYHQAAKDQSVATGNTLSQLQNNINDLGSRLYHLESMARK